MVLGVAVLSGCVVLRFVAALRGLLGGALVCVLVVGCVGPVGVSGGSVGGSGDRVGVGGAVPVVGGRGGGVGGGGFRGWCGWGGGVVWGLAVWGVGGGADGSRLVEVSSGGVLNVLRGG